MPPLVGSCNNDLGSVSGTTAQKGVLEALNEADKKGRYSTEGSSDELSGRHPIGIPD